MLNSSMGVPEFVRVAPASGCPDPVFLPQIQPSLQTSLQYALTCAIQAPPPTPGIHSP